MLCSRLLQVSGEIRATVSRVQGAFGHLEWEVRGQGEIEAQASEACRSGLALADDAEQMARRLWTKVQDFAEADQAAAESLGQVFRPIRRM